MKSSIDVTKLKGYKPNPHPVTDTPIFPQRHACGRVLYADLSGEIPMFYPSVAASAHDHLIGGYRPLLSCPYCDYPLDMDWMRPLYLVYPMPYSLAVRTCSNRVCSNCWGELHIASQPFAVEDSDEAHVVVLCHTCRHETISYVTRRYVGYAREQDYIDYGLCVIGLSEALGLDESDGLPIAVQKIDLSSTEKLALLGF